MRMSELKWIAHERYTQEANINLICFPYAGGSATYFAPLKSKIDKRINVCPVLYPGREMNKDIENFATIEELAENFVKSSPNLFTKPFVLFGHCLGAIVAFETATFVNKLYGKKAELLIVSSAQAPEQKLVESNFNYTVEDLTKHLIKTKMIDKSFAKSETYKDYFLPLIIKDMKLHMKYSLNLAYQKIDTPLLVMYGNKDKLFRDSSFISKWKELTYGEVESKVFPGGRFYIDNNRTEVAEFISDKTLERIGKSI